MPTPEEIEAARRRLGLAPARPDQQQQRGVVGFQKPPLEPVAPPVLQKPTRGGLAGFMRRMTTPLVDAPNLPGGVIGDVIEGGLESVTSPVGLLTTALIPVTGGGSLALRAGAGAAAKTLGQRFAVGALSGGVGGKAAEVVGKKLPEGTPGIIRVPAAFGAAALAGGGTSAIGSRLIGGGSAAVKAAAATADEAAQQSLGGYSKAADEFITALGEAATTMRSRSARQELKALRGQALSKRVSAGYAASIGAADSEVAERAARSAMKGTLPRLDFPELTLAPQTLKDLHQEIWDSDKLTLLDKYNALDAYRIITVDSGIPSKSGMVLLERVFGPAFTKALANTQPYGVKQILGDVYNLPRAMIASFDQSWYLNQGLLGIGASPKSWARAVKDSTKALVDPAHAEYVDKYVRGEIGSIEHIAAMKALQRAGLKITGSAATEETLKADRLIGTALKNNAAGGGLRATGRSFLTAQNKFRTDIGEKILNDLAAPYRKAGMTAADAVNEVPLSEVKRIVDGIDVISGRSSWKAFQSDSRLSGGLNAFFFAPSFLASRVQYPVDLGANIVRAARANPAVLANPKALYQSDPVLAMQMRALGGFMAQGMGALGLMKLAKESGALPDVSVEADPRASTFGKIKVGPHAYDFWGGYSQIARTIARVASGEQASTSGKITPIDASEALWDQFVRSKVAPVPGLAWDAITGTTYLGERVTASPDLLERSVADRIMPLAIQDIMSGYANGGVKGAAASAPAFFGQRMTSFYPLYAIKDDVAEERFGKKYSELSRSDRAEVDSHTKVLDKQREWDLVSGDTYQNASEKIDFERITNENLIGQRYLTQQITRSRFADEIEAQQRDAAVRKKKEYDRLGLTQTEKTSPLEQAYQQWLALYDIADFGAERNIDSGAKDWDKFNQLEASLFKSLTPEQVAFIEERKAPAHDKSVEWYFNNKKYISQSGYYDIVDAEFARSRAAKQFDSYGDLLAAADHATATADIATARRLNALLEPIKSKVAKAKENARRKNPALDAALIANGAASKPVTTKAASLLGNK